MNCGFPNQMILFGGQYFEDFGQLLFVHFVQEIKYQWSERILIEVTYSKNHVI